MDGDTEYQCLMAEDASPTYGQDTYEGDGGEREGETWRGRHRAHFCVSKNDAPLLPNFLGT